MKKPMNYYCHRKVEERQDLPSNYQVIGKVGEGAFGQVFKVFDRNTSSIQVVKYNKQPHDTQLEKECEVMQELSGSQGFARVKPYPSSEKNYVVMSLLGNNIGNVMQKRGISIVDMKRIASQLLKRLQEMHLKGYVHRDLKPENVLLGNQKKPHRVYLVDFGLASKFNIKVKRPRRVYQGEIGTIKYCPIASHYGKEQYPKDDLQSLGYLLVFLTTKKLPWSGLPKDMHKLEKYVKIRQLKEETDLEKTCLGIGCLKRYFKLLRQLTFSDPIDYDMLLNCFTIEASEHYCYSFCEVSCPERIRQTSKQNILLQDVSETEQGTMKSIKIREIRSPR